MKAFVAITLLAACAAAQTFDIQTGLRQQLLKREHGLVNGLWKDVFGIGNDYSYDTIRNVNTYPYTVPTSYNTVNGVNTLSLDEIIHHPLFQTYSTLPLFRQHFTHPLFQLYLTTPYFQQYWTHPIFTTFFRNPYLFNKYIYPVVYNTIATGVYDHEYDFGLNTKKTTTTQSVFPFETVFGKKYADVVYPFNTGYPINNNHVQYPHVIDKILKTLVVNKPEVTEVKFHTETPVEKKTFTKFVDPITGEIKYTVDDFKTIDEKIVPVEGVKTILSKPVDTIFEGELLNDAILKSSLNKAIFGDRKVEQTIPEIFNVNKYQNIYPRELLNKYETVTPLINKYEKIMTGDLVNNYETIPRELVNKYETIPIEFVNKHLTTTPFLNKYVKTVTDDLVNKYETIPHQFVNRYETVTPFLNKLEKMTGDHVNTYETIPREIFNKYETVTPFLNKYEKTLTDNLINKYETIPRQFVNKYETVTPFLNKYEKTMTGDLVNKYETIPRDFFNKYETVSPFFKKYGKMVTGDLVNKYETIPRELINKYETIPRKQLINKVETVIPRDLELTKKIESDKKIENIVVPDTVETTRARRDTTKTDKVEQIREAKDLTYVPLTQTFTHQPIYTIPATQYIFGQEHNAQVPLVKDAKTLTYQTPITTINNLPLTYSYGTQHTIPITHGVQEVQQSLSYPGQIYITA